MGLIVAKFRRKKTSVEVLEKLDNEIKSIEDYRRNTEQRHKRIVGKFLVFSIGVYVLSALLFYFYFYPTDMRTRLLYMIPLVLAPSIIFILKRLLTGYYNRKISKNQGKLVNLREEKVKMLENIMETETYKVARSILEKYAPDQVRRVTLLTNNELTPVKPSTPTLESIALRNRFPAKTPKTFGNVTPNPSASRMSMGYNPVYNRTPVLGGVVPVNQVMVSNQLPPTPMPRTILPRERSLLDKMVEYLVGDGPSNRYALICKNCSGHNGMALKEEFEYISFNCCYCFESNLARKKRPQAPKLEFKSSIQPQPSSEDDTSESEKNSHSDSEEFDKHTEPKTESVNILYTQEDKFSDNENEVISEADKASDVDVKASDGDQQMETSTSPLMEEVRITKDKKDELEDTD